MYIRENDVKRNFGNKVTWERSFEDYFKRFNNELTSLIFDNYKNNTSNNFNALECKLEADLIYIDPPYINKNSHVSYHQRYHFLEALVSYDDFDRHIDFKKKNKEVKLNTNTDFEHRNCFFDNLKKLIVKYSDKIIVISYRKFGIPSIEQIEEYLCSLFLNYNIYYTGYSYALHKNNGVQEEVLIIVKP